MVYCGHNPPDDRGVAHTGIPNGANTSDRKAPYVPRDDIRCAPPEQFDATIGTLYVSMTCVRGVKAYASAIDWK